MTANSLIEIDRNHLIHPVTAFRTHEKRGATVLTSAKGMYLTDMEGNRLLDAFAGLWCVNVGYGQESIVEAAADQMRRLPYATGYFHYANEPAIRLAERLAELSPPGLDRVYFTLGGSDAVDSAIRFIVHYFNATGRPAKKQMIALDKGYHGSSTTGAGLTGLPAFHRQFDVPHAWQHHIPAPYAYRAPVGDDPQAVIDWSGRPAARQGGGIGGRKRRRLLCGAGAGIGRRHRAAEGLAEGDARRVRRAGHIAGVRRGYHRFRPHRAVVRLRA